MVNLLKVNQSCTGPAETEFLLVQVLIIEPLIHRLENVRAMTNILMINWIMLYVQTATIIFICSFTCDISATNCTQCDDNTVAHRSYEPSNNVCNCDNYYY